MKYKQGDKLEENTGYKYEVQGTIGKIILLLGQNGVKFPTEDEVNQNYTLEEQPWEPKEGELYWYISSDAVPKTGMPWRNDDIDNKLKNFMGIYPTKEKAEEALVEIKRKLSNK